MADGKVVYQIVGDNSQFNSDIEQSKKIASDAATAIAGVFAAAFASVGAFVASSIKAGSEYYSSMSEVKAITGAAEQEFDALNSKAQELGAATAFSAKEAADAMIYMGMAGWDTQSILDGVSGVMDLAAASGEDLALTSDIVTDALTAFGMTAADTQAFVDILAATATSSNTTVSLLGETFKYVAPLCGTLGFSAEDAAVAIGLMANSGIKGSQAGTALKTAIANMVAPTDQMAGVMDALGISITDSKGEMLSLDEIMEVLRTSFGELDEAEQAAAASTLFGKEAMSGMLSIIKASKTDYDKLTKAIRASAGAAKEMAEIKLDNLAGDVTLLESAFEGLKLLVFDEMNEGLRNIVQGTNEVVNELQRGEAKEAIEKLGDAFDRLSENVVEGALETLPQVIDVLSWMVDHGDDISSIIGAIVTGLGAVKALQLAKGIGIFLSALDPLNFALGVTAGAVALFVEHVHNVNSDIYEFRDRTKKAAQELDNMRESVENGKNAFEQEKKAIEDNSVVAEKLAFKLVNLSKKTEKTAADKKQLAAYVEELNTLVPELGLHYDGVTDSLNKSTKAILEFIEQAKNQALLNESLDEYVRLTKEAEEIQSTLAEKQKEHAALMEKALDLTNQIKEAQKEGVTGADLIFDRQFVIEQMETVRDEISQVNALADENAAAMQACETAMEGYAAASADAAPEVEQAANAIETVTEAQERLVIGSYDVTEALASSGKSAEEVQDKFTELAEHTRNMFSTIKEETALTMGELVTNLEQNQAIIEEWQGNLESLKGTLSEDLLVYLEELGPSAAGTIENIASASDEELVKLQTAWDNGSKLAIDKALGNFNGADIATPITTLMVKGGQAITSNTGELETAMDEAISATVSAAETAVDSYDFDGVGYDISAGIAAGVRSGIGLITAAVESAAKAAYAAAREATDEHSPSRLFAKVGYDSSAGWAVGVNDGAVLVSDAVRTVAKESLTEAAQNVQGISDVILGAMPKNLNYRHSVHNDIAATAALRNVEIIEKSLNSAALGGTFDAKSLGTSAAPVYVNMSGTLEADGYTLANIVLRNLDDAGAFTLRGQ